MPAMFTIGNVTVRASGSVLQSGRTGLRAVPDRAQCKDQQKLTGRCRGALADRLEILRVKDRPGAGALLLSPRGSWRR